MRMSNFQIYKAIIFNILENKCKQCGNKTKLHLHHKDYEHTNNKLDNVELLCKKCHYQLHSVERITKGLKRSCRYCRQEFKSLNRKQLTQNVQAHELSCKQKIIEETNGKIKLEEKEK